MHLPIGRDGSLIVKTTDRYGRTIAEVISEMSCCARGTAISMAMGRPANPCADSRLLPYRVAPLLVATEAIGGKSLAIDLVD